MSALLRGLDQVQKGLKEEILEFITMIPDVNISRRLAEQDLRSTLASISSLAESEMTTDDLASYVFNSLRELDDEESHVYWSRMSVGILAPDSDFCIKTLEKLDKLIKCKYKHRPVETFTLVTSYLFTVDGYSVENYRTHTRMWHLNA